MTYESPPLPPPSTQNPSFGSRMFSSENKILLTVIGVVTVCFFIVFYGMYINYQKALDNHYEASTEMIQKVVSAWSVEHLTDSDENVLDERQVSRFVNTMMSASDDIVAIRVFDNGDHLVYEKEKPIDKKSWDMATKMSVALNQPLNSKTSLNLGHVEIYLTQQTLKDIKSNAKNTILWIFLGAWFITMLAVSAEIYLLSKHLRTFVRGVKRLSTGDFGYKIIEHDLWGELRTLAESFNEMSMKLRIYEDQNLETITFERNKLKAILLSIVDGVIVCDNQGKLTIINDASCQMLGFKDSQWAIDTNIQDYVTTENKRCFEPVLEEFQILLKENNGHLPEGYATTVEMPEITIKVNVSPIQDSEGEILGFIMILHDITKEAEVDKLKTNFISNVSHELRTPVTTIKSYVDTLCNHGDELDGETRQEFIQTINVETDRLKKLVNDILDFSRLEQGFELEKELVDITPVINLTVQSIKVLAEQKDISLTTAIESNLPKAFMNSDSIERVVRNLLSNAIKYTDDGGRIKVRAEVTRNGRFLEVTVQDNGAGISEEHLPHIFERFYRVENKVHTIKGTGLGLHLVKVAIEEHHEGEVFVKSDVGSGSTFGFRLPLQPAAVDGEVTV